MEYYADKYNNENHPTNIGKKAQYRKMLENQSKISENEGLGYSDRIIDRVIIKVFKRLFFIFISISILTLVISYPNPVTHKCVPNARTILGLSQDGYPQTNEYCGDGYYAQLKWGERYLSNFAWEAVMILGILIVVAIVMSIILFNREKKKI